MYKLILLAALLPLLVCVVLRLLLSKKKLEHADAIICQLSAKQLHESWEIGEALSGKELELQMRPHQIDSKKASALGYLAFLLSREELARKSPAVVIRKKLQRTAALLPAFGIVLGLMGILAMRFSAVIAIILVATSVSVSCILLLLTVHVDLEAAKLVEPLLRKNNQVPRMLDREAIQEAAIAAAWDGVLPAGIKKLF